MDQREASRRKRQTLALRDNLKRRKVQKRDRSAVNEPALDLSPAGEPAPVDQGLGSLPEKYSSS